MSNRAKRAQKLVIEEKLEEMVLWYIASNGGRGPEQVCEDDRTHQPRGIVMRWLEPLLPAIDNPVLIEEALGDSWTLRIEPMQHRITL